MLACLVFSPRLYTVLFICRTLSIPHWLLAWPVPAVISTSRVSHQLIGLSVSLTEENEFLLYLYYEMVTMVMLPSMTQGGQIARQLPE